MHCQTEGYNGTRVEGNDENSMLGKPRLLGTSCASAGAYMLDGLETAWTEDVQEITLLLKADIG